MHACFIHRSRFLKILPHKIIDEILRIQLAGVTESHITGDPCLHFEIYSLNGVIVSLVNY